MLFRYLFLLIFFISCNSSKVDDALELIDGIDRKPIDVSRMGINAFANKSQFGSPCEQYSEIKNVLGLKYLRILINWNEGVQAYSGTTINWSFYDNLLDCVPAGADALLVVNGLPDWFNAEGNPRINFVDHWFKKVFRRYNSKGNVVGFQVWNEPNAEADAENVLLGMHNNPTAYLEMLAAAYSVAKDINSSKLILNAATTAIAQNFRGTLNYNKQLKEQGIENFIDRYAIHYYGTQFERVVTDDGVKDFLNSLSKPVWITESGIQGFDKQLAYVETVWPYLRDKINNLDRIYYYQFASNQDARNAFGLKNISPENSVSDLYVYLSGL